MSPFITNVSLSSDPLKRFTTNNALSYFIFFRIHFRSGSQSPFIGAVPYGLWFVKITCVKDRAFLTVMLNSYKNLQLRMSCVSKCFVSCRFPIGSALPGSLSKAERNNYSFGCQSCSLRWWVENSLPCESGRLQLVFSCRVLLKGSGPGTSHSLFVKIQKTSVVYRKSVREW